jgi:hypothetical protein
MVGYALFGSSRRLPSRIPLHLPRGDGAGETQQAVPLREGSINYDCVMTPRSLASCLLPLQFMVRRAFVSLAR